MSLVVERLEDRLCLSGGPFVFVSSYGNNAVMRYDEITGEPAPADGQKGATFVSPRSCGLNAPLDALLTPDGSLLVDSAEDNSVVSFDGTTGDCLGDFVDRREGLLFFPTGMVFSPDSSTFVVANNGGTRRVLAYDYDGSSGSNGRAFITDPDMGGPVGMLYGPDGYLYVSSLTSNDVRRYDPATGELIDQFIPAGSNGLSRPGGIAFGPDGNLYVCSQNNNEILRFDGTTGDPLPADGQDGAVFVPSSSGGLRDPAGLLFGPDDNLYVVGKDSGNVLRYDGTTGEFIDEFIPAGSGGLSSPRAIFFGNTDPSSLNYVHDGGNAPRRNIELFVASSQSAVFGSPNAVRLGHGELVLAPTATGPDLMPAPGFAVPQAGFSSAPSIVHQLAHSTGTVSDPVVEVLAMNLLDLK